MKYLLDTNVISELVVKQPNERIVEWVDALPSDQVYLSVITIGEIRKGIEKLPESKHKADLKMWLRDDIPARFSGHVLDIDVPTMLAWGEMIGQLEQSGRPLAAIDSLIAATAKLHSLTIVTRNDRDFDGTGVSVINPWQVA
jgi:toxin FitB